MYLLKENAVDCRMQVRVPRWEKWSFIAAAIALAAVLAISAPQAAAQATFEVRVAASSDDAEQRSSDGYMYLNSSDLELAVDGSTTDTVGMRFTGVTIPQGTTITNAYIQFKCDETDSGAISLTIRGQDIDDAPTFTTSSGNITSRTKTTASVAWSPPAWSTVGQAGADQRTPDITAIIQEIVDRSGWSSGNDLAIIITGTGTRTAEARDGDSSGAPLLHVEYEAQPNYYYVRPDGNDSNAGTGPTAGEAWQTVVQAVTKNVLLPGDVIYVKAGTYAGSVQPDEDGSSGNPIRVIADRTGSVSGWSAGDVILQASGGEALRLDGDNYWRFEGFKILGISSQEGAYIRSCLGVELANCEISGAKEGIRTESTVSLTVTNCIIRDSVEEGVYVRSSGCTVNIVNCTVAHNAHDGIEVDRGTVTITNSIFSYNNDDGIDRDGGSVTHTYNLSYGNGSNNFEGTSQSTGELISNPQFTDAAGRDYHLQSSSPAINSGTDVSGTVDDDLDGVARPLGGGWDMGCYEYPLIGIWEFDEGVGTTAADSSGSGNDGTLMSTADWTGARCAYAVDLNGTSDWVDLGQLDIGTSGYTVGAWFKTSRSSRQTIFAATAAGTGNHLIEISVEADGTVQFLHRYPAGTSGGTTLQSTDVLDDGDWHYVTAVKSSSTVSLYIDGELVDQDADTTGVESSLDVVLGRQGKTIGQDYFSGAIDKVTLYGTALSATDISVLFGLVGHWRLDETSGTTAADSTNYGNDGTLYGGFSFDSASVSPGQVADALEFDGGNDYIDTNMASNLATSITMTMWFKSDDAGSIGNDYVAQRFITQRRASSSSRLTLGINNNRVAVYWYDGGDALQEATTTVAAGQWYHAAVTYDGSTVRLYINGVEDGNWPESNMAAPSTDTCQIGCQYSGTRHFDGVLDDVRIYDRALCSDEIAQLPGLISGVRILSWVEIK